MRAYTGMKALELKHYFRRIRWLKVAVVFLNNCSQFIFTVLKGSYLAFKVVQLTKNRIGL